MNLKKEVIAVINGQKGQAPTVKKLPSAEVVIGEVGGIGARAPQPEFPNVAAVQADVNLTGPEKAAETTRLMNEYQRKMAQWNAENGDKDHASLLKKGVKAILAKEGIDVDIANMAVNETAENIVVNPQAVYGL